MNDTVFEIKKQIENGVKAALQSVAAQADEEAKNAALGVDVEIEVPKDKTHGDFSVNTAMKLTKILRKNPRELANSLVEAINTDGTYIDKIEMAGP